MLPPTVRVTTFPLVVKLWKLRAMPLPSEVSRFARFRPPVACTVTLVKAGMLPVTSKKRIPLKATVLNVNGAREPPGRVKVMVESVKLMLL